ncbi:unnamed protein product [Amoebophrya sp. A25]|nr:unnamed protein product [Amoebophrya sp. A25]|eukprot:GSA25T00013200001.1
MKTRLPVVLASMGGAALCLLLTWPIATAAAAAPKTHSESPGFLAKFSTTSAAEPKKHAPFLRLPQKKVVSTKPALACFLPALMAQVCSGEVHFPQKYIPIKADSCPAPYPDLDMLQDDTIESELFKKDWPQNALSGTWPNENLSARYVVAAADAYQPTTQYKCTSYKYSTPDLEQDPRGQPTGIWHSFDMNAQQWKQIPLQGYLQRRSKDGALIPGGYEEIPLHLGAKSDKWFVPVVHYGQDSSTTMMVKWGCTSPPMTPNRVNFVEVLARSQDVDYTEVIAAISHLMQEGQEVTPVIEFMRPVDQSACNASGSTSGMSLCRGPECDENGEEYKALKKDVDEHAPMHLCRGPDCDENQGHEGVTISV